MFRGIRRGEVKETRKKGRIVSRWEMTGRVKAKTFDTDGDLRE